MAFFETLFSSFTIGNLRLKNRILMAATGNNFPHPDGTVSDRAIAYCAARAHGGAGLIITETSPGTAPGAAAGLGHLPETLHQGRAGSRWTGLGGK